MFTKGPAPCPEGGAGSGFLPARGDPVGSPRGTRVHPARATRWCRGAAVPGDRQATAWARLDWDEAVCGESVQKVKAAKHLIAIGNG